MSWRYSHWRPHVPVAKRRANAARELGKLTKRSGSAVSPVVIAGRTIATTFWGKAWCENLEAYSDYENRLPRGRTYVRNGSVVDLQIARGTITARVSGSSLYRISVNIQPLSSDRWNSIRKECAGGIDSLLELLQGKLSNGVMQVVTRPKTGLFPSPAEIDLDCSCPDWADLCKHVAAVLYGVGARLDQNPALLFELRGVDPGELVSADAAAKAVRPAATTLAAAMTEAEMADVFGIELDPNSTAAQFLNDAPAPARATPTPAVISPTSPDPLPSQSPVTRSKRTPSPKPKSRPKPAISPAVRARMAAAARARWAKAKAVETRREKSRPPQ